MKEELNFEAGRVTTDSAAVKVVVVTAGCKSDSRGTLYIVCRLTGLTAFESARELCRSLLMQLLQRDSVQIEVHLQELELGQ